MFVRAANPIWYLPDLVGQPLNDEYYAFFLTNTLPYLPQNVYHDPQGMAVWSGDIVQFFPNGTLPDNLYFDPSLVYRIEVRHGNTQADELIYEVNNFVPGQGSTPSSNSLAILGTENQISNSVFSVINFVSPLTITLSGTYSIGPDWDLVLTGSGTMTITQLILSGDQFPDNPPPPFPYALRFASTGWSSAILRQRFTNNGALWSLGAITGSVEGRGVISNQALSMNYVPSDSSTVPGAPTAIFSGTLTTGDYITLNGAVDVNFTGNTDLGTAAYVDIQIVLPPAGSIELTNIQIIGQTDPLPLNFNPATDIPTYQQETDERINDHLFHYYKSQLLIKPKDNLLVGCNFSLNPFQFITTTVTTITNETQYICDQIILHQEAASQVQTGQNTVGQRHNLIVKAVTAATTTRFALIEYIDPATIRPYWSYVLSAFIRARLVTDASTSVHLKCRLIYRTSLPSSISNTEPIASWSVGSDPVFAAGWTALIPQNDPSYLIPNSYATDEVVGENAYPGFSFNQFQMPNATNADMTLGIVFYTMDNLHSVSGHEDSIEFDRASLIPSFFGADASPETFDENLRKCQFYYEKSYPFDTLPGTMTALGQINQSLPVGTDGSQTQCFPKRIYFPFKQTKRAAPTVTFYTPAGTVDNVWTGVVDYQNTSIVAATDTPLTQWTQFDVSQDSVLYNTNNTNAAIYSNASDHLNYEGFTQFQYIADSRLGV